MIYTHIHMHTYIHTHIHTHTYTIYLWKHKLISKHQHGILTKHYTSTQLLECVNDWSISLSNKNQVDVAYLDFATAF